MFLTNLGQGYKCENQLDNKPDSVCDSEKNIDLGISDQSLGLTLHWIKTKSVIFSLVKKFANKRCCVVKLH